MLTKLSSNYDVQAQQIQEQNETVPKPTLTESLLLREQHFGVGAWRQAALSRH